MRGPRNPSWITTAPFSGESWCEDKFFLRAHNCNGKVAVYRFHVADPIPFREKIRVSIEHGHANDRSDDIAVTAYWYQSEPHCPASFDPLPPAEERQKIEALPTIGVCAILLNVCCSPDGRNELDIKKCVRLENTLKVYF